MTMHAPGAANLSLWRVGVDLSRIRGASHHVGTKPGIEAIRAPETLFSGTGCKKEAGLRR